MATCDPGAHDDIVENVRGNNMNVEEPGEHDISDSLTIDLSPWARETVLGR